MNYRSLLIVMCLFICCIAVTAKQTIQGNGSKIILEIEFPKNFNKSAVKIQSTPFEKIGAALWNPISAEPEDVVSKWILFSSGTLIVNLTSLGSGVGLRLFEPGDSIRIVLGTGTPVYSGKGTEKFSLLQELTQRQSSLKKPSNPSFSSTLSLSDYFEWNIYLNKKLELMEEIFEANKSKITPFVYEYLKAETISDIEYMRLLKFGNLKYKSASFEISADSLGQIFDSTVYNNFVKWLHIYKGKVRSYYYYYDFVRNYFQRKYNFHVPDAIRKTTKRKTAYIDLAKKVYSGEMLQGFLVYLLTQEGLRAHIFKEGSDPEIEQLLKEFYAMPGYPDHKAYVKSYEERIRGMVIQAGGKAPDFSLEDPNGKMIAKDQFRGKLVLLSFLDNSSASHEMTAALKKVQRALEDRTDVVFLNVSVIKDKHVWKKMLTDPAYQMKNVINVYTDGEGKAHPILNYYNVRSYPELNIGAFPSVFVLNGKGEFIFNGDFVMDQYIGGSLKRVAHQIFPDPRKDHGSALINKIYQELALMGDGPYIFHQKGSVIDYSIQSSKLTEKKYPAKSNISLISQTDNARINLPFRLKNSLQIDASETSIRPNRLFVLSDIEGNFEAFRKLLQANKIIDEKFNWIFGKGYLVFAGDMFDRGLQVTECLWLVYALEEKAKKAGGYVHFILGNHEIMNLQGDHRYVEDKYKENAKLIGKTLTQLYNEDSELGRWLRTKNIVEKIGDLLFMHGGFSQELNKQPLTIEQLNSTARPFYADSTAHRNANTKVSALYNSTTSPFWYRSYYEKERFSKTQQKYIYKPKESQVDSTLQKFNVKHIITGHTVVSDTISTHYNHKVINTDTQHAKGKSEALLIEGNNFYRVNDEGKRVLLFRDEEK
jgi:hypothetical protein